MKTPFPPPKHQRRPLRIWLKAWCHHPFCETCRRDVEIRPEDPWFPNSQLPKRLYRMVCRVRGWI